MTFMIDISGMEVLQKQFEKLQKEAPRAASYALYEGAGVVADAVSREVQGISTEPFKYVKNGQKRKPSPEESLHPSSLFLKSLLATAALRRAQ